jgi:DNA repair protein RecO (recombination protein O)
MSSRQRVENQVAFLLHAYPWRETSLIAEIFTREYGRIPLVAKGARRTGSAMRGVLMAFQPLETSWTGKSEIKTLTQASWRGGQALLSGVGLLCGYYLNELLLKMLPREDPHPALFDYYAETLEHLSVGAPHAPLLRLFELVLLRELGYEPTFDRDADTGESVQPDRNYFYLIERGPRLAAEWNDEESQIIPGRVLLAMAGSDFGDSETLGVAKNLMRRLIHYHLGGQTLESRRILIELQEL